MQTHAKKKMALTRSPAHSRSISTAGIFMAAMSCAAMADNWDASAPGNYVLPGNAASKLVIGATTAQDRTLTVIGQVGIYSANSGLAFKNTASSNKIWQIASDGNNLSIHENGIATRMSFLAGGVVGIGGVPTTTVPSTQRLILTTPQYGTNEYVNLDLRGKVAGVDNNFAGINFGNAAVRAAAVSAGRDGADNKGKLVFSISDGTGFPDAMVINSAGNVGIGGASLGSVPSNRKVTITTPQTGASEYANLEMQGKVSGSNSNFAGINFNNGSLRAAVISAGRDGADNKGKIIFSTYNGASFNDAMFIAANGYVGIGLTIPQSSLHVVGTTTLDGNVGLTKDVSIGGPSLGAVPSNRKVGITTPQTGTSEYVNLELQGKVLGSNSNFAGVNFNNGSLRAAAISAGRDGADSKGKIIFSTYNGSSLNDAMFIDAKGSVGIGISSPAVPLHVVGNAKVDGELTVSSVTTKVWTVAPDYVFEKDYDLASLDRVESYIDKNKHLPEIPSAKEISKLGINLADMNMKLLRKVEELTLYAIRQDKELKAQADRILKLESSRQ